ncbi:hypothetical protein [Kitasatospora herbaricolor]|uniref:Uncharacterized protein n=1 Tax=Kitasatospora herbaricolor TaxID=68217 RepID=A0ABZ1WJF9_9ACTN|nr:hypothetical protein [Kitasatospora herbaricolor]
MANNEMFGTDSGVGSTIALLEAHLPSARERRSRLEEELAAAVAQEGAITSVLEGLRALAGVPFDDRADSPRETAAAAAPVGVGEGGEAGGAVAGVSGPEVTSASDRQDTAVAGSTEASPAPAEKPARKTTGRKTATRAAARKATAGKAAAATSPTPAGSTRATVTAAKKTTARRSTTKGAPKAAAPKDTEPQTTKKALPKARKASASKAATVAGKATVTAVSTPSTTASAPGRRRLADAEDVLAVLSQASNPLRAREVVALLGLDAVDANINAIRTRLERLAKSGQAQRSGRGLYTVAADRPGAAG